MPHERVAVGYESEVDTMLKKFKETLMKNGEPDVEDLKDMFADLIWSWSAGHYSVASAIDFTVEAIDEWWRLGEE